jgi:beta-glucanase (GH16 family)
MAIIQEDRILETSSSSGTGDMVLVSSPPGFRRFNSVCAVNDTFYGSVVAVDSGGAPTGQWETGYYTYINNNVVSRTVVLASSAGGTTKVNFAPGIKQIFIDLLAYQIKNLVAPSYLTQNVEWYGDARVAGFSGGSTTTTTEGARPFITDGTVGQSAIGDLIFSDEFNGSSLNTSKWSSQFTHWNPPQGVNNWRVTNGELRMWMARSASGSFVTNNRTFTTDTKWAFRCGYLEAEMFLSRGRGHWPAFWTYSIVHPDPWHEEIDVMEAYGGGPENGWATSDRRLNNYGGTVWRDAGSINLKVGDIKVSDAVGHGFQNNPTLSEGWFKYGALWEPDGITFYFNGRRMGPKFFHRMNDHHAVLLDLWWSRGYGEPTTHALDESNSTRVQYVRVWRLASGTSIAPGSLANAVDSATPTSATGTPTGTIVASPTPAVFARRLPPNPPYTVTNRGVGNNTTVKQLNGTNGVHTTWSTHMANSDARLVFLQFGASDQANGVTSSAYQNNLSSLIASAKSAGKFVVVVTPPPVEGTDLTAYADAAREAAKNNSVPVIDFFTFITSRVTGAAPKTIFDLMPDGLHPDQDTYLLKGQFAAQKFSELVNPQAPNNKVAYFGDSTIVGWDGALSTGAAVATPAPARFAELQPAYAVSNLGVNGATIREHNHGTDPSRPTFQQWLSANDHHYIIMNFALNDVVDYSVNDFRSEYAQALSLAVQAGRTVLLETPNPASRDVEPYVLVMRELAGQFNVGVIDQYDMLQREMAGGTPLSFYLPDGLHPSQATYTIMGEYAASVFQRTPLPAPVLA